MGAMIPLPASGSFFGVMLASLWLMPITVALHASQIPPKPRPAIDAILEVFDHYPIVALGMSHRQQDEADFSLTLIRDPRFAEKVNDIVVECGNPLYQATVDQYIDGADVPLSQLQLFWRNTTQPGSCDPRQHEELLDAVREVNHALSPGHKIRVLGGDPPIDWDKAKRPEDVAPFMEQRDTHFASVVEQQVLAKNHHALFVIGAGHVLKRPISWSDGPTGTPTITMIIDAKHPHSVFVLIPHDDFGKRNAALEPKLAEWAVPSLVALRGTWVGELDAGVVFEGKIRRVGSDPNQIEAPFPGLKIQDIADAYLYLGPIAKIRQVEFLHETGTDYARELERRRQLLGVPLAPVPAPVPNRP